ncbi:MULTISPECIES: TadE/TadG family type IV pilus assembly protein [unclassified Massilia]|uniref:TadE/TadG family type IV pilus assembly protein n=1 Tax=unclassified Massilia TaxID=2609279 RepID=UPI001B83A78D|nr:MULTISPECIES: TadE family protein [unclassified Massilia]MBQ5940406.1 pilus assembly protein [Massilia sp. AB1]MBQ5963566.1 pilus assembly protein [Massilia sp. ZL223]
MKRSFRRCFRRTEQGSVAVETAIVLPVLILFLAVPFFLARIFWYYSVAEKAAHDGARFLTQASRMEIQASTGGAEPGVAALARAIANAELDEIRPGLVGAAAAAQCDGVPCDGLSIPSMVRVVVRIRVRDEIFGFITDPLFGEDGLLLTADVTMRYAGN